MSVRVRECVITRDIDTYRMNDKHLAVKLMLALDIFRRQRFWEFRNGYRGVLFILNADSN